ncbi:hypothetical protein OG21DRAFT_586329 [Imleria badia]|nr:hypothetical protein OG21DRAFT_586329 [Imleria badia]
MSRRASLSLTVYLCLYLSSAAPYCPTQILRMLQTSSLSSFRNFKPHVDVSPGTPGLNSSTSKHATKRSARSSSVQLSVLFDHGVCDPLVITRKANFIFVHQPKYNASTSYRKRLDESTDDH